MITSEKKLTSSAPQALGDHFELWVQTLRFGVNCMLKSMGTKFFLFQQCQEMHLLQFFHHLQMKNNGILMLLRKHFPKLIHPHSPEMLFVLNCRCKLERRGKQGSLCS